MNALAPSSLGSDLLARRLRELAGEERSVQVDFVLHLDEFDRRRAFRDEGHDSLWSYCLRALHLREGAAGRRIGAMRALRRFPALEAPLRDGRICLSTVTLLAPLLSDENLNDLVSRAAYRTKADVEHLVASLQPRVAPKDGIRKVTQRAETSASAEEILASAEAANASVCPPRVVPQLPTLETCAAPTPTPTPTPTTATATATAPAPMAAVSQAPTAPIADAASSGERRREIRRPELRPVSADEWSLRVTMNDRMRGDLETLKSLLSHKAGGDLAAVLHEAIRCGIEKHGKRKGAVKPTRLRPQSALARPGGGLDEVASAPAPSPAVPRTYAPKAPSNSRSHPVVNPRAIPIAVRREVWLRDEGCCSWRGKDGQRCGSRWKLELDHIRPVARGGTSTTDNLRLVCRAHNVLHAEQVFGREHMARFGTGALFLEIAHG